MQIKFFESNRLDDLSKDTNEWLMNNRKKQILDIKLTSTQWQNGDIYYCLLIILNSDE